MRFLKYASLPLPIFLLLCQPDYACAAVKDKGLRMVMQKTFVGGPGEAILQLMLIATVAYIAMQISNVLGGGNISKLIKIVAAFSCLSIAMAQIWGALAAIGNFLGV
ncbi:hypothetical protein [Phosphitispora fastidiosa]|uniref:hypothetical protein n=1 Tax=Phosphitispora fastidiosa TaxID=2837202 RepID=UPI001E43A27E|nr:hypothetical protein [Phosphitispora fastidiosa]MBU7006285.1 hypothetical protein [Phosphitispora fastidiosa]